jgi:hypothetical protein
MGLTNGGGRDGGHGNVSGGGWQLCGPTEGGGCAPRNGLTVEDAAVCESRKKTVGTLPMDDGIETSKP